MLPTCVLFFSAVSKYCGPRSGNFTNILVVNYLLVKSNDKGAAISIIVIYFLLFIPMAASFFRVLYLTIFYPPYVPLGPAAIRDKEKKGKTASEDEGIGAGAYKPGNYRNDIDSPGLELFYSKDAFVCEQDGKPIWCSHCGNVRESLIVNPTFKVKHANS